MELAIPLIALGGMYVISNQSSTNKNNKSQNNQNNQNQNQNNPIPAENFTNMGLKPNYLPNTIIPSSNYPSSGLNQVDKSVQEYPNPNAATDKYFNQTTYEQQARNNLPVGNNIQDIYSLSGNYLNSTQFKHNNMVPFNGGKVKGNTYHTNTAETMLDNMTGAGSQVIKKVEQAPLFKPEDNMQWAYGTPNNSDFFQSRVNPGMKNNNIKPFDSVLVGPGLDKGYSIDGSNGFNSGMEARDKWMPYTVDQLRVSTNPKLEYNLTDHEGPANSFIKNAPTTQLLGRVEKQKPDTFYINTQDRWLTTTGAEKGETLRPTQEMGIIKRADMETDYAGPAGACDVKVGHAPENYEPSRRSQLPAMHVRPSAAIGRGTHEDKDNFLRSHTNYENHRTTVKQPDTMRSGFRGTIGAVIAPIMDIFRPTRKEETTNNIRIYGEASSTVPHSYVINPNDTTNTTIKETTLYAPSFNINNQKEGLYVNNYVSPDLTQRDTTSNQPIGPAGGSATTYGDMNYDAVYRQHNNDIKSQSIYNRPNQGGTQIFNQQMKLSNIKSDTDRLDGRVNPAYTSVAGLPPSAQTFGIVKPSQYYNESAGCDRIQPDILNAFRSNPYTHSLTTSV